MNQFNFAEAFVLLPLTSFYIFLHQKLGIARLARRLEGNDVPGFCTRYLASGLQLTYRTAANREHVTACAVRALSKMQRKSIVVDREQAGTH